MIRVERGRSVWREDAVRCGAPTPIWPKPITSAIESFQDFPYLAAPEAPGALTQPTRA
jgi:hypothetical protein